MSALVSLMRSLWVHLVIILSGLVAFFRLVGLGLACLVGRDGTVGSRLGAALTAPGGQRLLTTVARAFVPNLALRYKAITAYDNGGTVIVTRFSDVKEVLARDDDFEVVYGPRMTQITGGANFFLGMQDSPEYTRDVSNMRLAIRRTDLPVIVQQIVSDTAAEMVKQVKGRIDVPQDLSLRVPARLVEQYFGTPGPSEKELIEWTTTLFWYLFLDLKADPTFDARALEVMNIYRAQLDDVIAQRKAHPTSTDDILNRCLAMQQAGLPGMDDLGIRNNLIGLVIGAIPTTSKAAVQALDQLLNRPAILEGAQSAARNGDDELLARYVFEALRFNPLNPAIYRRANKDTQIAANTLRAVRVRKSDMVLAFNFSAMFDRLKVEHPEVFSIDRPWDNYILWGDGLHTCFGSHINQVTIPGMLKPLLRKKNLRRAAGLPGKIDCGGTPFPVHMWVEFDPT
ncbi:MAG TPA: cytochrome P450 [Rhizomicrobium sp.]|jgi:cytochrome P450